MASLTKRETEERYIVSLLSAIQSERQECLFTDFTIECGQKTFAAHRVILHAGSPYFRELFGKDLPDKLLTKVELLDIEPEAMETVLKFIYTGNIEPLTQDDSSQLKSLLAVTHLLQVKVLYEYYWNEFSKRLTADSYVDVWRTAEMYGNVQLLSLIPSYLAINFQDVSLAADFLELNIHQLKQLLETPETHNSAADCIADACLKWIKYNPDGRKHELVPLFSCVDCGDISNPFLGNLLHSEPLVTECTELFDKLFSVAINRLVHTEGQRPYRRPFFVCCGKLEDKSVISMYDFKANVWSPLKVLVIALTLGTAVASYDGALYFAGGGETVNDATDSVYKYYPATNSVTTLASLLTPKYYAGFGVLHDKLYLVGGMQRGKVTNCVECYDPTLDLWISIAPTMKTHSFANVASLRDNLYVVGSYKCSVVESYNAIANQWTQVTEIPQPLGDGWPRATVHLHRIWVFRNLNEKMFHVYNPDEGQWEAKDFDGGPENVYGLWSSSYEQQKPHPLVVLDSSNYSYYLFHDETRTWTLLPSPRIPTDCYYWQSLIFVN